MTAEAVRVLIVDDHPMFVNAVRALLEGDPRVAVVGTEADGPAAVATAVAEDVDVVLMDHSLPTWGGIGTMQRLHALCPGIRVIVISGRSSDEIQTAALDAGAAGYLMKGDLHHEVADAVLAAAGNGAGTPE